MVVRLSQERKAFWLMVSNPSEKVTALRFLHSRKALSPMVFTFDGIVTEMIEEPRKALLPIVVTLGEITTPRTPQFQNA